MNTILTEEGTLFKEVIFLVLVVFVAWILIFQFAVPFFQGMPFFPFFRSGAIRRLEGEIADVKQDIEADTLKKTLANMKPKLNEELPQAIPTQQERN